MSELMASELSTLLVLAVAAWVVYFVVVARSRRG